MGCTQSKIEHEEAVSRCKERKAHMKDAVAARNTFAAFHTAYTMALKNTGAALSDYGEGEAPDTLPTPPVAPPPREQLPPPPPLPPGMSPSSLNLLRSASMPADMALPKPPPKPAETIPEEDDAGGPEISAPVTPSPPPPLPRPSATPVPPPPEPDNRGSWDFFFDHNMHGPPLMEATEDGHGQVEGGRHQFGESVARKKAAEPPETPPETPQKVVETPSPSPAMVAKPPKKPMQGHVASAGAGSSDGKKGKTASANVNLVKILDDLDDHFLKASESAQEVSKMLEANRMHYHSNFADNRGMIMMCILKSLPSMVFVLVDD